MGKNKNDINWLKKPEDHDYTAAENYLNLIYPNDVAKKFATELKNQKEISFFKSKDIFRASSLSLLGTSNWHVEVDRKKIRNGKQVSPILLVRDTTNGKVVIADGYHRLCAVYSFSEDVIIPCKIV